MLHMYYERGFSVVPTIGKVAAPGTAGWNKWALDRQPKELIDRWAKQYPIPAYGIGIICGPASGIMALDIDSESEDIKSLSQKSNISRFGAKGSLEVFQYSEAIPAQKKRRDNQGPNREAEEYEGVEVLSTGNYFMVPPSIHNKTGKPYVWTTKENILTIDKESIEQLDPYKLDRLIKHVSTFPFTSKSGSSSGSGVGGRNEKLTHMACAMICSGIHSDDYIIDELIKYDRENHKIRYFEDKDDQWFIRSRFNSGRAAALFFNYHKANLLKKGMAKPIPKIEITDIETKAKDDSYPELPGLLGMFKAAAMKKARREHDGMATGAALALGSVLSAHRFHVRGNLEHTKLYILNIAKTGVGKDSMFSVCRSVLSHPDMASENLLGFENYSSKAAILETLTNQPVRLDIRDEFKDTLIASNNNKGSSGNEISSFLNMIYTFGGRFSGHYTKTDKWVGACMDPSISIIAGIQPEELIGSSSSSNLNDGFFPRFLCFYGNTNAKWVGRQNENMSKDINDIVDAIKQHLPQRMYKEQTIAGIHLDKSLWTPNTVEMVMPETYERYALDYDRFLANEEDRLDKEGNNIERAMLTRRGMFVRRLTTIIAACSGIRTLSIEHMELAQKIVELAQSGTVDTTRQIGQEPFEKYISSIMSRIDKDGHITLREVSRMTGRNKRFVLDVIDTMTIRGLVSVSEASRNSMVIHKPVVSA